MSYVRNAASPEPVTVGSVTLIADGSTVTSGASVRVQLNHAGWGAGGGTLGCDATSGATTYAPTQAETNGDVLQIAVYKASCIGCSTTVLMDPLDLAVNASKIGGTSQTGADVGGIVANIHDTDLPAVKVDTAAVKVKTDTIPTWPANFEHLSITDTTGLVAVAASQHVIVDSGTVTTLTTWDKTGYSLAASQHVIVDSGTVTTLTTWDKTGYSLAASQHVIVDSGSVTVSDKTGFSLAASQHVIVDSGTVTTLTNWPTDSSGVTELLTRIPDATAGATGGLLIAGSNAASTFATLTITSGNLPADVKAYTVQPTYTGLALTTDLTTLAATIAKMDTMLVLDGAVYRYTANSLELGPASTGGDATAANQTTIISALAGLVPGSPVNLTFSDQTVVIE